MSNSKKWNLKTDAISQSLVPLRGCRQVAKIMHLSRSAVFYIEKTALQKIAAKMRSLES